MEGILFPHIGIPLRGICGNFLPFLDEVQAEQQGSER